MKTSIIFYFLLILHFQSQGQNLIYTDSVYHPGLYRSFDEFKYNNPSLEFNFIVSTKDRKYETMQNSGIVTYYMLDISKKEGKKAGKVLGFCDGNNVYINEKMPKFNSKTEFTRIDILGRYGYFEDVICTPVSTGTTTILICDIGRKLLDIQTGDVHLMNRKRLRELIKANTALLEEFEGESGKDMKIKEYIFRYFSEIKTGK